MIWRSHLRNRFLWQSKPTFTEFWQLVHGNKNRKQVMPSTSGSFCVPYDISCAIGFGFQENQIHYGDVIMSAIASPTISTSSVCFKAQVTLCRSGGPDLYDLKNRRERHGRLMKSWQHRTDILEVYSGGKRSAVIGKPVRQSFTVTLSCWSWLWLRSNHVLISVVCGIGNVVGCRTQREGIRGQRVGIRGQRMDGREDRINITIASCLISVTFTFSYISRYEYIYICVYMFIF